MRLDWEQANALLRAAQQPILVTHTQPDGDAFGSLLGLGNALIAAMSAPSRRSSLQSNTIAKSPVTPSRFERTRSAFGKKRKRSVMPPSTARVGDLPCAIK
ncbi:MAG: hypothetical protein CUN50_06075, partial [Candidatus Thermofonsia Clade 1 bacterium]